MRNIQLQGREKEKQGEREKEMRWRREKKRKCGEQEQKAWGATNRRHGEEGTRYSKMWLGIPMTCINELLLYQTDR